MNNAQPPRLPLPTSTCTCILRQQITCTSTLHKQASFHGLKMTMASPSASPTAPPVESTQAHVLEAPRKLGLRQIRLESFSPMDVQIRIHSVAISTTDIMYFETNLHNGRPLHGPIILGREATGEIIAVGAMAARTWPHLQIGSRIAIEPGIPCRICHDCASGKYNICVNMRAAANASREPYVHGFLRQYLNWPGEMVHPLPTNLTYDMATLGEPLARVIHATKRVNLQPSTSVAVLGSGLISLLTCAYARSLGCYPICIIDTDEARLDIAMAQDWATHKYTVPPPPVHTSSAAIFTARKATAHSILREMKFVSGYETVMETTGSETGLQLAYFIAKRGGKIASLNGIDPLPQSIPVGEGTIREIDLISCHGYAAGEFPAALSCLASGSLGAVKVLLTHKVPFLSAEKGFKQLYHACDKSGKSVIRVLVEGAK